MLEKRCNRMTKCTPANPCESQSCERRIDRTLEGLCRVVGLARACGKDKRPGASCCPRAVFLENLNKQGGHGKYSSAPSCFGHSELAPIARAVDLDGLLLEIYVRPRKSEKLGRSETREHRRDRNGAVGFS